MAITHRGGGGVILGHAGNAIAAMDLPVLTGAEGVEHRDQIGRQR
jgi:hypothetical protein